MSAKFGCLVILYKSHVKKTPKTLSNIAVWSGSYLFMCDSLQTDAIYWKNCMPNLNASIQVSWAIGVQWLDKYSSICGVCVDASLYIKKPEKNEVLKFRVMVILSEAGCWYHSGQWLVHVPFISVTRVWLLDICSRLIIISLQSHLRRMLPVWLYQTPQVYSSGTPVSSCSNNGQDIGQP